MTNNQINFNKLIEDKRHNVVTEGQRAEELKHIGTQAAASWEQARVAGLRQAEDARANREKEAINWFQSHETARSNAAREYETQRSNLARERETERSNLSKEELERRRNQFTEAHYINQDTVAAKEAETHAHQATSQRISALASQMQAHTSAGMLLETQRANIAQEQLRAEYQSEIARSNMAKEYETNRHNLTNEGIDSSRARSANISAQAASRSAEAAMKQAEVAAKNANTNRGKAIADTVLGAANIFADIHNNRVSANSRLASSIIGGALRGR